MVHHNHWDLEVIARDLQERRGAEAERARLVAQARRTLSPLETGVESNVAGRIARAVRAWLSPARIDTVSLAPAIDVQPPAAIASERPRHLTLVPRNRSADPYAAMVVVARPVLLEVVERTSDC